jgi:hypothetical protein
MTRDFAGSRPAHTFFVAVDKKTRSTLSAHRLSRQSSSRTFALTNAKPRIAERKIGVVVMVITS